MQFSVLAQNHSYGIAYAVPPHDFKLLIKTLDFTFSRLHIDI